MIYLLQKHFAMEKNANAITIRAGMLVYALFGFIVLLVMKACTGYHMPCYDKFYQSWAVACTGMILILVSVIECGVMLVVIIGKMGNVERSLPQMIPQCSIMLLVILVNIFALKNPDRFRQLNRDLIRVQENNPEVEEVPTLYIWGVVRWGERRERKDGRRRTRLDFFLEFEGKTAEISEEMYESVYAMIPGRDPGGIRTYYRKTVEGRYRIRYLPNSMIILDVEDMNAAADKDRNFP